MIYELNHVGLVAQNLERSLEFYRDSLGGKVVFRKMRLDGTAEIVYVRVGEGMVEMIGGLESAEAFGGYGTHHVGFMTDDISSDYERLVGAGAVASTQPARAGTGVGTTAFIFDGDGTRLELVERDVDFRAEASDDPDAALGYVTVFTQKPEQAAEFYTNAMSMTKDAGDPNDSESAFYSIGADVLRIKHDSDPRAGEIEGITFVSRRVDSVLQSLKQHGFVPDLADGRQAWSVLDPDGNRVEIQES